MITVHLSVINNFSYPVQAVLKKGDRDDKLFTLVVITTFISGCAMIGIGNTHINRRHWLKMQLKSLNVTGPLPLMNLMSRRGVMVNIIFVFRHDGVMLFHPVS